MPVSFPVSSVVKTALKPKYGDVAVSFSFIAYELYAA